MFTRIAVVNRGEPAVRLIRAVRELDEEHGYGIKVIALHTEAEQGALFVRSSDESVCLRDVSSPNGPYLDLEELERALRVSRADAVWVGWGFVAEDPAFAGLCDRLGLVFIGPPARAMRQLCDRIEARLLAEKTGVPVAPWSGGPVSSPAEAVRHGDTIGYPLVIKARSGRGGRGIWAVRSVEELEVTFERAQTEAETTFGDPVVFMESLVDGGRNVEVQIMADAHGTVWAPGVRDCSIQRRNNWKLVEESRSPALGAEQEAHLRTAAVALMRAAGYRGAGTVEFTYQPSEATFVFVGVDARLQSDHPVTEAATGLDLVKLQLLMSDGHRLGGEAPPHVGHAIEARLNVEDADQDFAPAPGTVVLLNLPSGPGIRVDTGIASGDVIPPGYDSMVAKIIAWGQDRPEALSRLRCAVRETTVVLRGGTTNKSFLLDLLARPGVVSGEAEPGWVDRIGDSTTSAPARRADVALLSVAIDEYDAQEAVERRGFLSSARGGRPRSLHAVGRTIELRHQGQTHRIIVAQVGPRRYRLEVDGELIDVDVERLSPFESRIRLGGARFQIVSVAGPAGYLVEVDGVSHRIAGDQSGVVRAPAPAVVVAILVTAGEDVEVGATIAVLESMKLQTEVRAPRSGRVREVLARVNSQVDAGAPLVRLDRPVAEIALPDAPAVNFTPASGASAASDAPTRAHELLETMRAMITGFDVSAKRAGELVAEYGILRNGLAQDAELRREELALLITFADLCELSRNRPTSAEEDSEERVHSPQEHFHTYLHSLDVEQERLPEEFRTRLSRVLRHYGVVDLERSPELEEAVYRVFLAQQGAADQTPMVADLLQRWLDEPEASTGPARDEMREVLDRLIVATQLRFPTVGDLARSIRFRFFDNPVILAAREQVYAGVREHLRYLDENPSAADYAQRIEVLTAGPEPLIRLMAKRIAVSTSGLEPMIEVLTRRYYKIRRLQEVRAFQLDGRQCVTGAYELGGKRLHLISTMGGLSELTACLASVADLAAAVADPTNLVVDLYLSSDNVSADPDAVASTLANTLSDVPVLVRGRRVTVTVCDQTGAHVELTFRPSQGRMQEERVIRGMHPMIGQRFDLWRLKNFTGTPLPATEDTYLFHCVARDNPADERLVAFAEVYDVTPLRDASGRVVTIPAVESKLAACLESMRASQAARGTSRRLDANRIVLYVWPPSDVPLEELSDFARASAPMTAGAGLEKITMRVRQRPQPDAEPEEVALVFSYRPGAGVGVNVGKPSTEPLAPLDEYTLKVRRSRARGTVYPYEIVPMLTGRGGSFIEHDLDEAGRLVPVDRPRGRNSAGIVAGLVSTPSARYPEGMVRVVLFGDPTKALGSVAEAECARIMAALVLAEEMAVPVEWFALSSGAMISMDSGTENMDWVARALRRLITFTQAGGEVNVVVAGINVGAQPYWNAEATMLLHTKGILVMTPESAMVLTGKHSLDYSGGVSAEDNFGIGGYDRVMGPNGQAQYWAPDLSAACETLFAHYEHTYIAPGERLGRRATTKDPHDRDVRSYPHVHPCSNFTTVGDIFSDEVNKERKKPFDIRTVMRAVADQDHAVLERWASMADADTTVVMDAHLGGYPIEMLGIESRPIPRRGWLPADGPDQWTAGTLFPKSSKKTARAINAASGNRPLVVLANLSGFDGSPESLRMTQLEYGAEIGRAIVNFKGPIVFCVISRFHGGSFVVFSSVLNSGMEVIAVEGSFASVIGGAPAAAVVFTRDVNARTSQDPRVKAMEAAVAEADEVERPRLRVELAGLRADVRSEKLGEVADEFEKIHNIERARAVGSVHTIIPARELRPYLIGAVERGLSRTASDTPSTTSP
ncbi:MAG TPA: biotin carboxylase N-terminal domain-containing protein [Dermatophilaceae bacterium]|nr:biotin carboxylase N-terminal domain-containing protein [Dermatophilaceae bacterium]